jgi:hypothetical protein
MLMKLYHGTTSRHLSKILAEGLTPGNQNQNSNWDHTVAADTSTVYLTNAYALFFANQALADEGNDDTLAVLEIDIEQLWEEYLVADEDAVEQTSRGKDNLPATWSVHKRTEYYRAHANEYSWEGSLNALGTCGYQNVIPPGAITRIALISIKKFVRMVMGGYDPFISIMNYHLMGHKYRYAMRWLFDAGAEQEVDESNPISAIMTMKLPDDRTGIDILSSAQATERFVVSSD